MKKKYILPAFVLLLSMMVLNSGAQPLNGIYTINSTIPSSATNFTSFTAFATAVNNLGVSGPVTANVQTGNPAYVEQVTFNTIVGSSNVNRVTINGNNNTLTFNSANSGAPHTLLLNGTDYMTVNDLTIEGQGGTYAMPCVLTNVANVNRFNNCKFKCPQGGTSTSQSPFCISGNATSPTASGDGGNFNTVTSCTMSNGYYGIGNYGPTGAPYSGNNSFIGCRITDFYYYGYYGPYSMNLTFRNCIFDRETRTTSSSVYLTYAYSSQGMVFEGNLIHKIYESNQGVSSIFYCLYNYGNPVPSNRNTYANNIITNIKTNGTTYGIYVYTAAADVYNNTIDYDYAGATTGNTMYGIYGYGAVGAYNNIYNNIITCRRGASGTNRFGIYLSTTGLANIDKNVIHMVNGSGNNNIGYLNTAVTTAGAWNALGYDLNGFQVDPVYTSATDLHPTNAAINNLALPMGLNFDHSLAIRNKLTPDIGALEFLTPMCSGTPTNSIVGGNYAVCPGETATLALGTLNPDAGLTYQWRTSSSTIGGPWTTITGATGVSYITPGINNTTYYSVLITCTAPNGTTFTPAVQINVAGTTTSTVPYNEGFEGIPVANKLPNCSWSASNMIYTTMTYTSSNTQGRTPRTGNNFASFYNSPAGANYFYTNGIWMNAGITYSASVWYQTESMGYNNWTDLSLLFGTTQTTTGLVPIVSTNGPAISSVYKQLKANFQVPTSGLYYVAIRATAANGQAPYLSWDDLSIGIPCSANAPGLTVLTNTTLICAGDVVVLSASGADSYYWSTGATTSTIAETPSSNITYTVVGTSSLSGCSTTTMETITVMPTPAIFIYSAKQTVCSGEALNLSVLGPQNINYMWANINQTGANITVNPTASTVYTVSGTNTYGCTGYATQAVQVNTIAPIQVSSSQPNVMCAGEMQTLTATGALSYLWASGTSGIVLTGNVVSIQPSSTTVYTVTGTDANGCNAKTTLTQNVSECTGVAGNTAGGARIYPNPTSGELFVEWGTKGERTLHIMDVTARVVSVVTSSDIRMNVDLSGFANGVYSIKIQSASSSDVIKVIKH